MSIEKINVNGITYDIRDVEDVATEIARAEAAEQQLRSSIDTEVARATAQEAQLQSNIDTEVARATAQEQQLQKSIDAEKARAQAAEGKLREGATARFARFVDSASISTGEPDSFEEVVYIKSTNKFAAADDRNVYWDTWSGVDAYMKGNEVRKDKVYLCGDATYVFHNGALRDRVAELIGEAPEALDSIHEIADWINNDKTGAAAMATQISENKAAITTESERAKGAESQLQSKIDADVAAEATRAQAAEKELNARKADDDGYHPKMSVGFSDNLVGRGEAVDAQFIYRPSGGTQSIEDGVARIERIKGNSIVWNQLAKISNSAEINENGVTITNDGDGTYSVMTQVDAPSTADVFFPVTDSFVNGRKVTFYGSPSGASASTYCLKAQIAGAADTGSGATIASTSTNEVLGIFIAAGTTINTSVKFTPQVFDLTQMFGAGREPSLDEFKALYPLNNYAYSAGELRSLSATAIKSVGFNALNLAREKGVPKESSFGKETKRPSLLNESIYVVGLSGNNYFDPGQVSSCKVDGGRIAVKSAAGYGVGFAVKTIPNTAYWLQYSSTGAIVDVAVAQYDATGVNLTYYELKTSGSFTTRANTAFCVIIFRSNGYDKEAIYDSICLNISHTGYRNGEVEDYKEFTRELPMREYFPNGMKSAGNAFDELTSEKAVKRIKAVDLGSCNWNRVAHVSDSDKYQFFTINVLDIAQGGNLFSTDFFGRNSIGEVADNPNGTGAFVTEHFALHVTNPKYNTMTATEFKEAMAGVVMLYETTKPETVVFDEHVNLDYEVSDFGTEEAISEENSAPFRADVVYGFNAVDTIRNNRTMIAELLARIEALEGK